MLLKARMFAAWKRFGIVLIISINLILLAFLSAAKDSRINASSRIASISEKAFFAPLDHWQVRWRHCSKDSCEDLADYPDRLTLPLPQDIQALLANGHPKATQVTLNHKIPNSLEAFFKQKKAWINLVIPRSLHQGLTVKVANKTFPVHVGRGQTLQFTIHERDLGPDRSLTLIYNFDDLPWFGPSQFPIAVVDDQASQFYADTAAVLETKSLLNRDWHIALPLLVASLNLIINHARIFSFLSLYLVLFSIRAIAAMAFDLEILSQQSDFMLSALHIAANAALLQFSLLMIGFSSRRLRILAQVGLLALSVIMCILLATGGIESLKIDLIFDSLVAAYIGIWICALAFPLKRWPIHKQIPFAKVKGKKIYGLSLFLLGLSIACLGFDNLANLSQLSSGSDKNTADGLALLHILFLCLSAFSRLGSTEKTILMTSKLQARHMQRSRERLAFQRFQQDLLEPSAQYTHDDVSWQCYNQGHDQISGDWHDLRHLKHWVAVALYDVTGHDLRAAGHHLLIAAQWRLALARAEEQIKRDLFSFEQAQILLKNHMLSLQQLFSLLPHSAGASGLCLFIDLKSGQCCYVAAGHHGFILEADQKRSWVATPSSRFGAGREFVTHAGQLQLSTNSLLYLFTDGNCQNQELGAYIEERLDSAKHPLLWQATSGPGRVRAAFGDDRTQILLKVCPQNLRGKNLATTA